MKKHIHLNDCDSTQDILKEQLMNLSEPAQLLVSCENQKMGRGRGENVWKAMPGTLCFSLNLRPHPVLSYTALEISVLVARFFEAQGRKLSLKWPNDLWDQDRKKCGGILVQGSHDTFMAGVGINLFSDDEEFGAVFEAAFPLDKRTYAEELADFILHHRYKDVDGLREDWLKRCGHLQQAVAVTEGNERFEGVFEGLGEHGECVLRSTDAVSHVYNGSLRLCLSNRGS